MGLHDFVTVFDHLDVTQQGFVTLDQLVTLLESVYLSPVAWDQVEAAIVQVCGKGHGGKVQRQFFLAVVEEVARRQSLEEQAYWDFQALAVSGSHRIKVKDALTLFQEYHGDAFSLHTWHAFLQSRLDPSADVYFDEIREWLCGIPSGEPAVDRDVQDELSRLQQSHWEHFRQDYDGLRVWKGGDEDDDDQQSEDTRRHAHRKLQKWNRHGVAAMMVDDGLDSDGEEVVVKTPRRRDAVSVADLLDAMETKYSLLMEALVAHMAAFAANMESEKPELIQQIRRGVNKLAKGGKVGNTELLPGWSAMLPLTLSGMMGPLRPQHHQQQTTMERLHQQLTAEGKSANEIDGVLKREHDSQIGGRVTCGQALGDLMQRHAAEKEWLLAVARGQGSGSDAPWMELCRLQRQLVILKSLHPIFLAAVAVGLVERPQNCQHAMYDPDRERSERLAGERLQERQGHALTRTTSQLPDIVQLQNTGAVNIRSKIVEEAELRYHLEREALMHMLQGADSGQRKAAGVAMSGPERHQRLTALRSQHLHWKTGGSGDSAQNFAILQEAAGLYWAERQQEMEKRRHNISDAAVNAAVLADLQHKQEVDFGQCLSNMAGKRGEDLVVLLKQESRVRFQEQFSTLASVVLGAADLTAEDQEFLAALAEKYRAVRDQLFVFALKDKHGHHAWIHLGREGRQGELLKLRKEEKKLRGDNQLVDMAAIIGPKSQALPALVHLVGEGKVYGKGFGANPSTPKPVNLLADLVPRFDLEQEAILAWLRSEEAALTAEGCVQKLRQLASLEVERFGVGVDGDYEAGLLALGLLERMQHGPGGRSKADKERQQRLAGKRVVLRRWRLRQGDPYKVPAEDKTPPTPGDRLSWQRAVLRSMQRRQAVERDLLLRVVQDRGFGELVEAAALMAVEERWQRQGQLADIFPALLPATPDGREEMLSVLEEAAALRVVGVRASARQKTGRALSEDEVSTALLTELQDLHDTELHEWLQTGLDISDEGVLQQKLDREKTWREEEHAGSVMAVLTRVDGDLEITDVFVKLMEDKYAALHEALLQSAVLHSAGERQSQKQRDKRLQAMRKELEPLWSTGDAEQIAKVLGADLTFDLPVTWLLGMERSKFSRERDRGEGQTISEAGRSEDVGVLAAVRHLLQRCTEEKEQLLSSLAGASGQFLSENVKLVLKSRLRRERTVTAAEEGLQLAALACGLAERQGESIKATQLAEDRARYGMLGRHEFSVRQAGWEGGQKKENLTVERTENRETLQDAVLAVLGKKHVEERQLLAEMLVNPRFEDVQRQAGLETNQQRSDRLAVLKARRQASSLDNSSDNLALLQEALVVLREVRRGQQPGQGSDDFPLNCEMMAALLMLQNCEAEQYLSDFPTEELQELVESQEQILQELRKNHCVNIAALLFSAHVFPQHAGAEHPLVEALGDKHDALRVRLLLQALISQMGEKNWRNLSERERQRRLMELKLKERQLRREGRHDELAALLGDALNNEATLKKLIGENRDEYERKLRERLEKRKQRLAEGLSEEECNRLEREEEEQEEEEARQRPRNVLQDLQHDFDQEREALLRQLQEGADNSERERQKRLLQLKLEQRRLRRDDDVYSTALLLHQHDQSVKDREADRRRQEQLARERLEAARLRRKEGRSHDIDPQLKVMANELETETDRSRLQEMALTALDLKHQSERDLLMDLLEQHSGGGQREEAKGVSTAELTAGLQEAGDVFRQWTGSGKGGVSSAAATQTVEVLAEAVALTAELRKRQLERCGQPCSQRDVQVSLLADLQQLQDTESRDTLTAAVDMDEGRLKQLTRFILKKNEDGHHDNVAQVILNPGEEGGRKEGEEEKDEEGLSGEEKEERRVVKALEMKYDALRDKLIIEALMKQHGEAEWKRLSEIERQRKVAELKRKERQLRREGRLEEIEELLGQHLKHKQDLDAMLGESQQQQKRRLEERLARRRQLKEGREAQGLAADEETLDAIQEEEQQQQGGEKRQSVLESLQHHLEEEQAALLAALSRHAEGAHRERERQKAVVRLQRESRRLQAEHQLDSAALLLALGTQQHQDRQESLLKERERQRQLARERLKQRRRQVVEGKEGSSTEEVLTPLMEDHLPQHALSDDLQQLQEGALLSLDKLQKAEYGTLLQLLAGCRRHRHTNTQLKTMSEEELRLEMTRAEKEHAAWRKELGRRVGALEGGGILAAKRRHKLTQKAVQRRQAQLDILGQALAHKLELEGRQLGKVRGDIKEEELWEELCISTMADLQERQMIAFNSTQDAIFSKNKEELELMRKAQRAAGREGWFDSLSAVAFSVEDVAGVEEGVTSLSDRRQAEARLQEEFLEQRQAILEKAQQEGVDPESQLRELEEQMAMKRKKLQEDMARQRSEVMQRLEARRRRQTDRSFEAEAAVQMLRQAESQSLAALDRAAADHSNQRSLLQERLQQRREARKRAVTTPRSRTDSPMLGLEGVSRSDSVSTIGSMGLRREKTVIEATVSEDQKQAIYNQLVKQQLNEQLSKTAQQRKQEEELKLRLEARKGKRENEVAALFSLGERQKTFLEQAKKGEQERQIAQMRERVSRVKYERTRKVSSQSLVGKGFAEQALEEGDETMEGKARQLQQQFQREAEKAKVEQETHPSTSGDATPVAGKSRMEILKERRRQKKQQQKQQEEQD